MFRDDQTRVVLASGGVLPRICVRCGAPAAFTVRRVLSSYWVDPPMPPEGSVLQLVTGAPPPRERRHVAVEYSLCARHHRWRRWGPRLGAGLGTVGAAVFLGGLWEQVGVLMIGGLGWVVACFILYARTGADPIRVESIEGGWACLRGVHASVVTVLPARPVTLDDASASGIPESDDASNSAAGDRVPCPDDSCVGIVGPDGRCGTCGRAG